MSRLSEICAGLAMVVLFGLALAGAPLGEARNAAADGSATDCTNAVATAAAQNPERQTCRPNALPRDRDSGDSTDASDAPDEARLPMSDATAMPTRACRCPMFRPITAARVHSLLVTAPKHSPPATPA